MSLYDQIGLLALVLAVNLLLFLGFNICHLRFSKSKHILFASFCHGVLGILISTALFFLLYKSDSEAQFAYFAAALITLPVAMLYATFIPVMVDRSLWVYVNRLVGQKSKGISYENLVRLATTNYVDGESMVRRRIHEQIHSKTLVQDKNQILLSRRGRVVFFVFIVASRLYGANPLARGKG